ncbi:Non-reducing end beta-L-arabinofuranosidase [Posidoniimonas corsicana]|uniref:Non-reducing end beta-L-arabinofuranosidase n=1 Tax=Posidoniimonas corsicana TaxID=1938618 RepID=A0A5C5V5X9_9BACT|nr:beta-L-arabinofuranosidase domain-containing protein [Posidoniimonas corsicana]TWT33948.1 Non-reducing end beta-L-arabinofuranosidase [Posidoniimonas corsicana]
MPSSLAASSLLLCALAAAFVGAKQAQAQAESTTPGDQFLDGIGETALVARYPLSGDLRDTSRHQRQASLHGAAESFADDEKFGRVLTLAGGNGGFVEIPGDALIGVDSVSVCGWVYLRSDAPWQRFFDFGRSTTANFFCTPIGEGADEGYRARITDSGWANEVGPVSPRIGLNKWVHLAVVLDAAGKTLTTYADGKQAAQSKDVDLTLEDVLDQENEDRNQLYLGKSRYETDQTLNAKLHDVRLYSIALSKEQVATIYGNGLSGESSSGEAPQRPADEKPMEVADAPTAPVIDIAGVDEVAVTTTVGDLPRLPTMVAATYSTGSAGPDVRVIWPAPKDNRQTLEEGTYTVTGVVPGADVEATAVVTVVADTEDSAPDGPALEPFPLGQVTLNQDAEGRDTLFMQNRDKFVDGLVATDPDSFLYMFRDAFGQQQPDGARPLGGWDSQTTRLRGHASGHYLSAIAQAYAGATYDQQARADLKQKMDYLIETLHELSSLSGRPAEQGGQATADPAAVPPGPGREGYDSDLSEEGIRTDYWNWGEGFISAYPPDQFIMLEQGATYGGRNSQVWAPYYTLHKILAGLLDCYEVGGNEKALEVAHNMGVWVHERLRQVPEATRISMWNRYIAGEYGGMNEVLARLYRLTDDQRMLECAQLFDNTNFFFGDAQASHGLARNVDTIRGRHANQHIPQIVGALETYRCSQDPRYYDVASNFWRLCTDGYMYAIGGVAGASTPNNAECFTAEPDSLFANGFSRGGQNETCATYNLLKLSRGLFLYEQDARYMDHYEQALYNHILASVDEDSPGNTYHVPLNPGSRKQFGNGSMRGFTCCNGTALESSTKLQDSIYFRGADNQSLYVNLFVPSTLDWQERGVTVTQGTSFPYSDRTKLTIDGAGRFDLRVRQPHWAEGVKLWVNGEPADATAADGGYLTVSRDWQAGDVVELQTPFRFWLSRVMDRPNIASIFYGPVLLAVEESSRLPTWRRIPLDANDLAGAIEADPAKLRFRIGELTLKPFFETYDRYSVYVDVAPE